MCKFDLHFLTPAAGSNSGVKAKKSAAQQKAQKCGPPVWQRCRETPPLGPRMGALQGAPFETFFAKVVPVGLFVGLRRI
jgi:hypothetical protein